MLTAAQIEFYRREGYLAVDNVFSSTQIDELRRVTDAFVEESRQAMQHTDVFDLEPGHTSENPQLRRIKDPVEHHPAYRQALHHQGLLDIVGQLIGPSIHCNGNKLNIKAAGFGSPVQWHQDWAFYPHTNDDLLAVGVAIDEMRLDNGPLLVLPGSHRGQLLNHHQAGVFVGAVTEDLPDTCNAVPLQLKAGSVSIHHTRALHASAPNHSEHPRRLLLFQFCAADAWPILGVEDWATFAASFVRGEPTQQPRLANVPVRIPLPEPERTGSIYEFQTQLENPTFAKPTK